MAAAPLAAAWVEPTAAWMAEVAAVELSGTASHEHTGVPRRGRMTNWACWQSPLAQSISPDTKRSQVSSLKRPNLRLLDPALIANVLMAFRAVVPFASFAWLRNRHPCRRWPGQNSYCTSRSQMPAGLLAASVSPVLVRRSAAVPGRRNRSPRGGSNFLPFRRSECHRLTSGLSRPSLCRASLPLGKRPRPAESSVCRDAAAKTSPEKPLFRLRVRWHRRRRLRAWPQLERTPRASAPLPGNPPS